MGEKSVKTGKHLVMTAFAVSIVSLGAGSAFAGEITGNGKWIAGSEDAPLNGKSECAYSGYQDSGTNDGIFRGIIAQSWGQIPKVLRDMLAAAGMHPSDACNPTRAGG